MLTLILACAIALAIAAAPTTAAADTAPLNLESCVRRALGAHPSLLAAARRVGAATERQRAASRRPAPELSFALENFGGALGGDFLESTVSLEQSFELGGDRAARRAVAGADVTERGARLASARRAIAIETSERFLEAWSASERLRAAIVAERHAADAVSAARERLRQGAGPEFERVRAEGYLATREVERRRAESERTSARGALAAQWGEALLDADSLTLEVPGVPPSRNGAAALATHPEQRLAEAARAAAVARDREALASVSPDMTVSAGVRHLEDAGGTGFVAGVRLPLPFGSGRSAVRASGVAEREAADLDARATALRLRQSYDVALERERFAHEAWATVDERVRPAAESALALVESGYRAGRLGYLEILEAQRSALDARLLWIETTAEAWRARIALDALLGLTPDARDVRDAERSAR